MSTPVRVGLLLVGHVEATSQHIGGDYPELYRAILEPLGVDIVRYDIDMGQFPDNVDECDGWLCSPSRLSAYDDVAWLRDTEELLRRIVNAEVPFVGICFGHQLLAQSFGGAVRRAEYGWGVGAKEYRTLRRLPWMTPELSTFSLIGSHQDQVVELPDQAVRLFESDYCPNGGFALGERAWTLQVHPEFTPELSDHLLAGRVQLIGAERVAQARASLSGTLHRREIASWMSAFYRSDVARR